MKTIKVIILILITFAVVWASQVKVDFTLRNNSSIRVTVPKEAFCVIEEAFDLFGTDTEENVQVAPYKFESEAEYEQFRQLWDIDSPALSDECNPLHQEQASHTADLSKDLFEKCLLTADFLNIQKEYAKCFAENMVKYGLLGTHSADIMSSEVFSTYTLPQDTFWALLHAFFRQMGFAYKLTHPSTEQTMLRIESTSAHSKKINEEYTGPSQATKMRTVLYSSLGPASSLERKRNEDVLVWLLLNIGGSSVDIQYTIKVFSEDTTELSQTIEQFTKENEKGASVSVEGLELGVDHRRTIFLHPLLQLIPGLSRLELINKEAWKSKELSSSISSDIFSRRPLKVPATPEIYLESAEATSLVGSIPNIKQLSLLCERLEGTAIDSLKKCTRLEKLKIWGASQPSAAVQAILTHLPSLKELSIWCQSLEPAAVEAFQACTKLERIKMHGLHQPSATVQAILTHLPSLKELSIKCEYLEPAAMEAFQACPQLEKLNMWGAPQSSAAIRAIARHLPSLKELSINCQSLEPAEVEVFQACPQLEKLKMGGNTQSS
ncbi:hypothetical protein NECID01_2131, partial [Nematocida sp. AWRm77]